MFRWTNFLVLLLFAASLPAFATQADAEMDHSTVVPVEVSDQAILPPEIEEASKRIFLSVPITFKEKKAFSLYFPSENERQTSMERAQQASHLLENALEAEQPLSPEAPLAEVVEVGKKRLEVFVRGYKIIGLDSEDFEASAGTNWEQYRQQLQAEIVHFVSGEMNRLKIQSGALKFFLSVFFALIGFILLRQVHHGFNKAELISESRKESFKPIALMSETLISGQTVGGIWMVSLVIGRMLAYLIVVLTMVAAIMGQFSYTRTVMSKFFADILSQVFGSLQTLVEAIPGLILSIALLLLLQLSLRVLNLFLGGVRSGKVSWEYLTSSRVPVVHFWVTFLLFILFGPLVVASAFGRFHTPLEIIFLLIAAVLTLATLPLLINVTAGSLIIWQGKLVRGQWIEVCGRSGEIADISLFKITITPEGGGRIFVPMILLLINPCFQNKSTVQGEFHIQIIRNKGVEASRKQLKELFPQELDLDVVSLSVSAKEYHFSIRVPKLQDEIREQVLTTLSDAHEKGEIKLTDAPIKEVHH